MPGPLLTVPGRSPWPVHCLLWASLSSSVKWQGSGKQSSTTFHSNVDARKPQFLLLSCGEVIMPASQGPGRAQYRRAVMGLVPSPGRGCGADRPVAGMCPEFLLSLLPSLVPFAGIFWKLLRAITGLSFSATFFTFSFCPHNPQRG